jgi:hypothetical protein
MVHLGGNKSARKYRSTQNKTPARFVLTPTPPSAKKKKTTTNGINLAISPIASILIAFCFLF